MYYTGGPAFSNFQNSTTNYGDKRIETMPYLALFVYPSNSLYYG